MRKANSYADYLEGLKDAAYEMLEDNFSSEERTCERCTNFRPLTTLPVKGISGNYGKCALHTINYQDMGGATEIEETIMPETFGQAEAGCDFEPSKEFMAELVDMVQDARSLRETYEADRYWA